MRVTYWGITALAALITLFGCGGWSPVSPSGSEQEAHVIAETARFAAVLRVDVKGKLTDDIYWVKAGTWGCPGPLDCKAKGWYTSGVVYYYRPWVVEQRLDVLTGVAAHEVCHAVAYEHDAKHAACEKRLLG